MSKEAKARIKINKLLEEAGWRFFDDEKGPANILLENYIKITQTVIDAWGNDYEKTESGSLDFLLLDSNNKPFCVLEAKKESLHPLVAKEQARKYANTVGAQFVILSNGVIHYLWDVQKGNPKPIYHFPSPEEIGAIDEWNPDRIVLVNEPVEIDYIVSVQMPDYQQRPGWKGTVENSKDFIWTNGLRFLRKYQLDAIRHLQNAVRKGKDRFLFEMATGTGKTLTSAAVIRLFLRTENAKRVLFLVDRLELEDQAQKAFINYLKPDYTSSVYKEHKGDWHKADIVVTTIQSLMFNNKYRYDFSPTDFDLIISDESHRSISGNARAVFEYFQGYRLGLTATPKDYLKSVDINNVKDNDPREIERRMLLDTYAIFGCEGGDPTFRYSLLDGVKEGFLINPKKLDARTEITTQLLSDTGYSIAVPNQEGDVEETETFISKDFEKKFFSDKTNRVFCHTFLQHALRDPITNEIGKTIVFAVSQNHARKITEILNEFAEQLFPGKYNSDFALQVTSQVNDAQQMTINFTNNKLNGKTTWLEGYKSSKTRICVTVGMMTTGYDCPDLLNLCMMRPIFSPADFVQVKGRGTRKHTFEFTYKNELGEEEIKRHEKTVFHLFDFFANCEYFDDKYDYDEKLELPKPKANEGKGGDANKLKTYDSLRNDLLFQLKEEHIGLEGMKIDRMLFKKFENRVKMDDIVKKNVELGNWDDVVSHIQNEIFDKSEQYFDLEKLRKAAKIDRKISIREMVEKIFGIIPKFKSKDEMLDEEFDKFISVYPLEEDVNITALKYFFKAYIVDGDVRKIIEAKDFQALQTNPTLTAAQFKEIKPKYREAVPVYIKDHIKLEQFAA